MTDPGTLVAVPAAALGAGMAAIGNLAYLRDVRAGRTVPHRGAWLVWTLIAVVAAVSHGAGGGRWSLVVLSAQSVGCLMVFGWSIRCGVGGLTRANLALLAIAGAGVAGWLTLSDPVAATCGAVVADSAGLVGVVPKIWCRPHSETLATYALAAATGLLGIVAAGSTDAAVLIFPAYYCVANALVARLIAVRRRAATSVRLGRGGPAVGPKRASRDPRPRTAGLRGVLANRRPARHPPLPQLPLPSPRRLAMGAVVVPAWRDPS